MLVQTLLLNSPFRTKIGPCQWERVWTPEAFHPEILTMRHSDRLAQSACAFARKFDRAIDEDILVSLAEANRND